MTNLNSRAFTAKGRIPLFYIASCKPGRKQVESLSKSQLQTCLKLFFLHSIYLARARTSEPAAVSDQVFDKKSRKHVANAHELVENMAANLVENQVCSQVCSWLE